MAGCEAPVCVQSVVSASIRKLGRLLGRSEWAALGGGYDTERIW